MKKMIVLAAAALLAAAAISPANAQGKANGPFADVPTDNWAYQSVEKLRDAGIVIGYPDGTFGGKRAMTRYEFATAIARLLAMLPSGATDTSAYVTKDQLADALTKVGGSTQTTDNTAADAEIVKRLSNDEDAITALKGLVQEFSTELKSLGVDVAAANARIDALDKRLTALEYEVARVKITGDINIIGRSDIATDSNKVAGIDMNGKTLSTTSKSLYNAPNVYKDIVLGITGRVSDNATAVITLDYGNYFTWLNNQSDAKNTDYNTGDSLNVYEAYLNAPASIPGIVSGKVKIGQFGTQLSPIVLSLNSPDVYSNISWVNNGNVLVNGIQDDGSLFNTVNARIFVGKAAVDGSIANPQALGIKVSSNYDWKNTGLQSSYVDNLAGVRLTYALVNNWTVGYNYLLARNDQNGGLNSDYNNNTPTTTTSVWGFDLAGKIGGQLGFNGEFASDQSGTGSKFANINKSKDNSAYDLYVTDTIGGINAKLGYRAVEALYGAPGTWMRLGSIVNPTNIQGGELKLSYAFGPQLGLDVEGDLYSGIKNVGKDSDATIAGLGKKDTIGRIDATLGFNFATAYKATLGVEDIMYNLKGSTNSNPDSFNSGKPTQSFVNIGLNKDVNKNAAVGVLYQFISYDDKSTGLFNTGNVVNGEKAAGGILWTQANFKF